jgi:hypothetical protein
MAIHALIEQNALLDLGTRKEFSAAPPNLDHKDPPLKWVPVVAAPDPAYDPATEKLVKAADVITLTELTEGHQVQALTAQEQAAYADTQDRNANRDNIPTVLAWLETKAVQIENMPSANNGNSATQLQSIKDELPAFMRGLRDLIAGRRLD